MESLKCVCCSLVVNGVAYDITFSSHWVSYISAGECPLLLLLKAGELRYLSIQFTL